MSTEWQGLIHAKEVVSVDLSLVIFSPQSLFLSKMSKKW